MGFQRAFLRAWRIGLLELFEVKVVNKLKNIALSIFLDESLAPQTQLFGFKHAQPFDGVESLLVHLHQRLVGHS